MKKVFLILALCGGGIAQANEPAPQLSYLSCGSVGFPAGATSISFTGVIDGISYLNITNVNMLGIPFTQQAHVTEAYHSGSGIALMLRTSLTKASLKLYVETDSSYGRLSDLKSGIVLNCSIILK